VPSRRTVFHTSQSALLGDRQELDWDSAPPSAPKYLRWRTTRAAGGKRTTMCIARRGRSVGGAPGASACRVCRCMLGKCVGGWRRGQVGADGRRQGARALRVLAPPDGVVWSLRSTKILPIKTSQGAPCSRCPPPAVLTFLSLVASMPRFHRNYRRTVLQSFLAHRPGAS